MASQTLTEFAIIDKLGLDRLQLLLGIIAEFANHTAGETVSVGDIAFDDRVADAEIGKTRVRDALALFAALGLIALSEDVKTLQPVQTLIDWMHSAPDEQVQQLGALIQSYHDDPQSVTPAAPIPPQRLDPLPTPQPPSKAQAAPAPTTAEVERPAPARSVTTTRFGRNTGRQPIRVTANAKSDEDLLAELEPTTPAPTPIAEAVPESTGPTQPLRPSARRASAALPASAPTVSQAAPDAGSLRRRWGNDAARATGTSPNAAALRRSASPSAESPTPMPAERLSSAAGMVSLPVFFRLLDELNERADRLRQAGLADDPNLKIDVLQIINKIQGSQE